MTNCIYCGFPVESDISSYSAGEMYHTWCHEYIEGQKEHINKDLAIEELEDEIEALEIEMAGLYNELAQFEEAIDQIQQVFEDSILLDQAIIH